MSVKVSKIAEKCAKHAGKYTQYGAAIGSGVGSAIPSVGTAVGGAKGAQLGFYVGALTCPDAWKVVGRAWRTVKGWFRSNRRKKNRKIRQSPAPDDALAIIAESWASHKPGPSVFVPVSNRVGWQRVRDNWVLPRSTIVTLYGPNAAQWKASQLLASWRVLWDRTVEDFPAWDAPFRILHVVAIASDFAANAKEPDSLERWPLMRPEDPDVMPLPSFEAIQAGITDPAHLRRKDPSIIPPGLLDIERIDDSFPWLSAGLMALGLASSVAVKLSKR